MAATGKTPILLYGSTTATNQPSAGNLTNSSDGCEIAINVADKNLFFKDSTNTVNTVPIRQSSASSDGWLSSTDWSTFNSKQPAGTYVTSVTGTAPVVSSGGTTPAISMAAATGSVNGYLTSTDWTTFNNKSPAAGSSSITTVGTITSGTWNGSTIDIAHGGTNATSFNAPSGSINGLVWFDGTRLVNDATTSDVGYNSSTNTFYANNATISGTATHQSTTNLNGTTNVRSGNIQLFLNSDNTNYYFAYNSGASGTANPVFEIVQGGVASVLKLDSSQNVVAVTGNFVVGTSGKGIDFSATAGTGTSELLADYEEGTWTPIIGGDSSESGQSYTLQTGYYRKIGNFVTASFYIVLSAKGTITTAVCIKGLPYTIKNVNGNGGGLITTFSNMAANWLGLNLVTAAGSTLAYVFGQQSANTANTYFTSGEISDTTVFVGTLSYYT